MCELGFEFGLMGSGFESGGVGCGLEFGPERESRVTAGHGSSGWFADYEGEERGEEGGVIE